RLLNVAASRARDQVVLVGNFEYLRLKAPSDGFVHGLIDHFEEHGEALELGRLLPLAESDWIDGLYRILPATLDLPDGAVNVFDEGTFYGAFAQDLVRARESVLIVSPFATDRGTARWTDALRAAIARGVRVHVVTRPANEFGGGHAAKVNELVAGLRALGVVVDLRSRTHEKFAMIDRRIVWNGSLNIFSHRDTHELMWRLDSPATCSVVGRFFSPPTGCHEDEAAGFDVATNPECPECGGPTVWNDGRFGIYFKCEDADC